MFDRDETNDFAGRSWHFRSLSLSSGRFRHRTTDRCVSFSNEPFNFRALVAPVLARTLTFGSNGVRSFSLKTTVSIEDGSSRDNRHPQIPWTERCSYRFGTLAPFIVRAQRRIFVRFACIEFDRPVERSPSRGVDNAGIAVKSSMTSHERNGVTRRGSDFRFFLRPGEPIALRDSFLYEDGRRSRSRSRSRLDSPRLASRRVAPIRKEYSFFIEPKEFLTI